MNTFFNEVCRKSFFFNIDEKKLKNVNKKGHRTNKHAKFWAKNQYNKKVFFQLGFCKKHILIFAISILISYNHFGDCKTQIISPN
jgi:hypothetical protein